ncbi:MAG TPA: hypothetical protein VGT61_00340 [Thermomicrobiales bacterium]|jgi:hypothetical protein|nr:hypothetical protein [Thermomicrobiales bacterium]
MGQGQDNDGRTSNEGRRNGGTRGGDPGRFAPGGAMSGSAVAPNDPAGQMDDQDEANLAVGGSGAQPAEGAGAPPLAQQLPAMTRSGAGGTGRPGALGANDRSLETPITGPGKREVDLYVRTYTTLLQSSGAISVSSLEPAHIMAAASLHAGATEEAPDMNAFMYSTQRLPACIVDVRRIVLAQTRRDFTRHGFTELDDWEMQSAPGRRRRWLYDGGETLAAYIASASDLDDAVPTIVAWQIEWNKFHRLFQADPELAAEVRALATGEGVPPSDERFASIGERLLLSSGDWNRLRSVWGVRLWPNLAKMADARKRFSIRLLGGSQNGYARSARQWWSPVATRLQELGLADRPLYLVSSNTHSIVNVLSGTTRRREDEIVASIRRTGHHELIPELELFERGVSRSPWENWLYFAARSYFAAPGMADERAQRNAEEVALGIETIDPTGAIDVGVQIIDVSRLDPECFDPRLRGGTDRVTDRSGMDADGRNADGFDGRAEGSDAVIVNINYPLGLAAYELLSQIGVSVDAIQGIYILGKAATLNGRIGDVMISDVVYDEHSSNTYWFDNCFDYDSLAPYLVFGDLLDHQKAVTVKGTYLQNQGYLDFFYREAYTVVEMEAGPYLSAISEELFPSRYPSGEAVNLGTALRGRDGGGLDLGILHYASDTPYTRAQTLGARGMDFYGLDSTYASTVAILRRIFDRERARLRG